MENNQTSKEISETNLDMFRGLGMSEEELQAMDESVKKDMTTPVETETSKPTETTENQETKPNKKETEEEPEVGNPEEQEQEEQEQEVIDNPFVTSQKKEETSEVDLTDVKIENIEKLSPLFKQAGFEVKSAKDLQNIASTFIENQTKLNEVTSENNDLRNYRLVFEAMPPDLFDAVHAWINDKDHREVMRSYASGYVDFNKGADEQPISNIMSHYYPGEFSEEDFQDIEKDSKMARLVAVTKDRFLQDKKKIEDQKKTYIDKQNSAKEEYTKLYTNALENLKKEPFANDKVVKDVGGILSQGPSGILSLFTDKDGKLAADAGKKLSYILYGEQAIDYYSKLAAKKAVKKAVSKEVEDVVTRSKGGTQTERGKEVEDDQKKAEEWIRSVIPSETKSNF